MWDVVGIDECGTEVVIDGPFNEEYVALEKAKQYREDYVEHQSIWVEMNARYAAEKHQQWLWENGYEDMY